MQCKSWNLIAFRTANDIGSQHGSEFRRTCGVRLLHEGCWPAPEHEVANSSVTSLPQHVHEAVHPDGSALTTTCEGHTHGCAHRGGAGAGHPSPTSSTACRTSRIHASSCHR